MNYLSEFRGSNMKYLIETGNWQKIARNDTVFNFCRENIEIGPVSMTWLLTRRATQVVCVMLCRSLSVLLYFYFWPLCCLSFYRFTDSDYP